MKYFICSIYTIKTFFWKNQVWDETGMGNNTWNLLAGHFDAGVDDRSSSC